MHILIVLVMNCLRHQKYKHFKNYRINIGKIKITYKNTLFINNFNPNCNKRKKELMTYPAHRKKLFKKLSFTNLAKLIVNTLKTKYNIKITVENT